MKATAKNLTAVLRRYADWLAGEPVEIRRLTADAINKHLDDVLRQDGFGTEGQQDPRGDRRDA